MSDKYFYYVIKSNAKSMAGLDHQTSNLKTLLSEAFLLNRTPIIPIFHLADWHNQGIKIKSHLDRYYDFSQIEVDGKPLKVIFSSDISIPKNSDKTLIITENQIISDEQNQQFDFISRELKSDGRWWHMFERNYEQRLLSIIPVNAKILAIASKASKILKNYNAIHIRRSDRLNFLLMNYYTSPKAIIRKLAKTIPPKSTLYLMSDEQKPGFFDELKQHYQIKRWFDLEPVKIAVAEFDNDNYFLYAIEKEIFNNADVKIITLYGNSDVRLYPDFAKKIDQNIRGRYRKFIFFLYRFKFVKFLLRSIFRRGKIYD